MLRLVGELPGVVVGLTIAMRDRQHSLGEQPDARAW